MANRQAETLRDTFRELRERGDWARIDYIGDTAVLIGAMDHDGKERLRAAAAQAGRLVSADAGSADHETTWWLHLRRTMPGRIQRDGRRERMFAPSAGSEIAVERLLCGDESPMYLGDGLIACEGGTTMRLTGLEGAVVESLIENGAMDKQQLADKSGVANAYRILARLKAKHAPLAKFILMPGRRGGGGYSVTIMDGRVPTPQ